jgi:hypothetical protein
MGVGFAELGPVAGVAVAGGWSALLDCGARAWGAERFTASTVTTSVATNRARDSFFALRFIVLLLTERRAHGNRGSPEFGHDGEESLGSQYAGGPVSRGPDLLTTRTGSFSREPLIEGDRA